MSGHQESVAEKNADLYCLELVKSRVRMQAFKDKKQVIVEALDLRRVTVARGVLNRQRMKPEVHLQQLSFLFRRSLVEIDPDELVGIVFPALNQTLVA